jgi:uncharacterized membrane protein
MQSEHGSNREQLSRALGWFSIALGTAELATPHVVARLIGVREDDSTTSALRALGAREIGHGITILAQPDRSAPVWSRVAGDAIDLGFLAAAMRAEDADRGRIAAATAAVLGLTALDVLCASQLHNGRDTHTAAGSHVVRVEHVRTINRPIEEVYRFWRNFQNFPRFMRHVESVEIMDHRRSRWRAKAPAGMAVEWDAELLEERENEWLAWRSLEGSQIDTSGSVRFAHAPGARGTEVRVQLQYSPPAGAIGRGIAWLFGKDPRQQISDDLHRFKQLMETGQIPLSDGPGLWRPAQPADDPGQVKVLAGVQP